MGKRLMNLKSTTKGELADGKIIGGKGQLIDVTIKRVQMCYGLAIRQNTAKNANPRGGGHSITKHTGGGAGSKV